MTQDRGGFLDFKAVGNPGVAVARAFALGTPATSQVINQELGALGHILSTALMRKTPIGATGRLSLSTRYQIITVNGQVTLTILQDAISPKGAYYRPFVNQGVFPDKPPPTSSLTEWVRMRFQLSGSELKRATFAVARKISRDGTRANPYTVEVVGDNVDEINKTASRIGQDLTVMLTDLVQFSSNDLIREDLR